MGGCEIRCTDTTEKEKTLHLHWGGQGTRVQATHFIWNFQS